MTITQTTCNSVTVNWTPPTDNGNAEITQYRVHVYKDTDHPTAHITDTTQAFSHRVTSLEPKTDYTVEVQAGNDGGFGDGSRINFTTEQTGQSYGPMWLYTHLKYLITVSGVHMHTS